MLRSASSRPNFALIEAIAVSAAVSDVRSIPPTMSVLALSRSAKPSGTVAAGSSNATEAPRFAAVSATALPSAPKPPVMTIVLPCITVLGRLLNRRLASLELVEGARALVRRLCGARLFHVPVSTDRLICADNTNRHRMGRGGQALGEIRDVGFELGDQAPLELTLLAIAERIEPGATQEFQSRHHAEGGHRPWSDLALLHPPTCRVEAGERPRADMEMKLIGTFKFAREGLLEFRRCKQARHFPLVLGGEQLVIGARDGCAQRLAQACVSFHRAHALNERAIPRRVSRIAIVRQMGDATIDQRIEQGGLVSLFVNAD